MTEKIKKWEEEIERITIKQKEMNQKSNERIRELRKKIEEAESVIRREENLKIAEAFREVFGEYNEKTLADFKNKLKSIKSVPEEVSHTDTSSF